MDCRETSDRTFKCLFHQVGLIDDDEYQNEEKDVEIEVNEVEIGSCKTITTPNKIFVDCGGNAMSCRVIRHGNWSSLRCEDLGWEKRYKWDLIGNGWEMSGRSGYRTLGMMLKIIPSI